MDPENFDSYGGVVHVEYCFQVSCGSHFNFLDRDSEVFIY